MMVIVMIIVVVVIRVVIIVVIDFVMAMVFAPAVFITSLVPIVVRLMMYWLIAVFCGAI